MKLLRCLVIALALGASLSTAQARDSFNIGINIGGYLPYAYPAMSYHAAPPIIYYDAPRVYYPAPHVYHHAPVIVYRDVYYGRRDDYSLHRNNSLQNYPRVHRHHMHHGYHR